MTPHNEHLLLLDALMIRFVARAVIGALIGAVVGVMLTVVVTLVAVASRPDDPSAGGVAIVVMVFVPGGTILGAVGGMIRGFRGRS